MTSILALLLAIASGTGQSATTIPQSGPIPEAGHSTIGYATVADALRELRAKPGVKISSHDGWTVIEEKQPGNEGFALWSFTPSSHPAHPAVAKRSVSEKDGQVWINMSVQCEADKEPCDQLVRDFQELNDRLKQPAGAPK